MAVSSIRVSFGGGASRPEGGPAVTTLGAAVTSVLAPPEQADGAAHGAEAAGHYLGALLPDRTDPQPGSRRVRLWDLPRGTLCPLIGVCLPMAVLRRVLAKLLVGVDAADDYTVHVTAITESDRRTPVAEALQRELDQRHHAALRLAAQAKTVDAVLQAWQTALRSGDVAGGLWASLTHPSCNSEARERICRDVHMMQHQRGASDRADLHQLARLTQEHGDRGRELAALRVRHATTLAAREAQLNTLTLECQHLQQDALRKDAVLAALRHDLSAREDTADLRKTVAALTHQNQRLQQRTDALERQLADSAGSGAQARARQRSDDAPPAAAARASADSEGDRVAEGDAPVTLGAVIALHDKSVLCVGGRTASVPVYRRVIEVKGGRFVHHDGGEKQTSAQLDASLAAADLVICQTGCVSHEAYWRVKDHCKRTGKRCVFVDNPSVSSLVRGLRTVAQV